MKTVSQGVADLPTGVVAFPTLQQLGLGVAEWTVLRDSGYLQQERRGRRGAPYWRLRFRCAGQTRTVYLGRDERLLAQVREELRRLQSVGQLERRLQRRLVDTMQEARRALRAIKQRMSPVLQQQGLHYHGQTIRRSRLPTTTTH